MKKKKWLILTLIVSILVVLYIPGGYIASLIVFHVLYDKRMSSLDSKNNKEFDTYCLREDYPFPEEEKIQILSNKNELVIHHYESEKKKGAFLTAHGMSSFAGGRESTYEYEIFKLGYDIYALDLTASGESEGDSIQGLSQGIQDVKAAIDEVLTREDHIYMSGYSWGAYSLLCASSYSDKINGVISFSSFTSANEEMKWSVESHIGPVVNLFSWTMESCASLKYGKDTTLKTYEVMDKSECKYLLFQGDEDKTVGNQYASTLYHYLKEKNERVTTHLLEGKNHNNVFYSKEAIEYVNSLKSDEEINRYRASEIDENIVKAIQDFLK